MGLMGFDACSHSPVDKLRANGGSVAVRVTKDFGMSRDGPQHQRLRGVQRKNGAQITHAGSRKPGIPLTPFVTRAWASGSQRLEHGSWLPRQNHQQDAGRAVRLPISAFPMTQRSQADPKGSREFRLGHSHLRPNGFHVQSVDLAHASTDVRTRRVRDGFLESGPDALECARHFPHLDAATSRSVSLLSSFRSDMLKSDCSFFPKIVSR